MLLRLAASLALLVLLAGCVISGPPDLVADTETTTPLPAEFTLYPYSERDGGYGLSNDDPMPFRLADGRYEAGDGKMAVRFVPLGDEGTYLVSIHNSGETDAIFGTAEIAGDILVLHLVLDTDIDEDLIKSLPGITPEITSDLTPKERGIALTRRATLDFVIERLRAGDIAASPLVSWIGTQGQVPPARIAQDATGFRVSD